MYCQRPLDYLYSNIHFTRYFHDDVSRKDPRLRVRLSAGIATLRTSAIKPRRCSVYKHPFLRFRESCIVGPLFPSAGHVQTYTRIREPVMTLRRDPATSNLARYVCLVVDAPHRNRVIACFARTRTRYASCVAAHRKNGRVTLRGIICSFARPNGRGFRNSTAGVA